MFCAASVSRIPVVTDELSDMAVIRKELGHVKMQVSVLIDKLSKELEHVKQQVSMLVDQLSALKAEPKMQLCESVEVAGFDTTESRDGHVGQDTDAPTFTDEDTVTPSPGNAATVSVSGGYTAVATQLQDSEPEAWKTVNSKRRPRKFMTGNSVANVSFKGVSKKSVVCISRLEVGTSADTISDYLTANGIQVISCFEVIAKTAEAKFVSMRLCVPYSEISKVYNSDIWPTGVVVRPWKFKARE